MALPHTTLPVERLRSLHDAEVIVTTTQGSFTGTVLSCTRLSVWLISDDEDLVVALDDIVDVEPAASADTRLR